RRTGASARSVDVFQPTSRISTLELFHTLYQRRYFVCLCFSSTLPYSFSPSERAHTMAGWTKAAEASFVPLQAAVFCAQCELISQNTARLIADSELDQLVRELISTVAEPKSTSSVEISTSAKRLLNNHANGREADPAHQLLLHQSNIDLAELDLEPTISLIAERAQVITAASGAAVALRRGNEIVCRAR